MVRRSPPELMAHFGSRLRYVRYKGAHKFTPLAAYVQQAACLSQRAGAVVELARRDSRERVDLES